MHADATNTCRRESLEDAVYLEEFKEHPVSAVAWGLVRDARGWRQGSGWQLLPFGTFCI